jgi:hypothetical protein
VVSNETDVPTGLIAVPQTQKANVNLIYGSELEAALATSVEWRNILNGKTHRLNLIKPEGVEWVNDLEGTTSPLKNIQELIALEELIRVLSFLTSPRPSVELLKQALEAVAHSA